MRKATAFLAISLSFTAATPVITAADDWKQQLDRASEDYFEQVFFHFGPSNGTSAGYHQYDAQLEDLSRKNIDAEVSALKQFEERIEAIHPAAGAADFVPRTDREILLSTIHSQLLEIETIRAWEKNADIYSGTCASGAFVLMERKFASPEERLRSLISREKQMPVLLDDAHANLKNPPRIFTEIAIEQLPGIIDFFQHDVPSAFTDAHDPALKAEFAKTNATVIASLSDYLNWLKTDLLPRSNGDFRIGAQTFRDKLKYDEMVDIPLDKLLTIGWTDLRKNQDHFKQVAHELEPSKTPQEVLQELGENHPAPDHLLDAFRSTFASLIDFIRSHHIVTIPSEVRPILEETPPFMRATTTASMDTPGPFETRATEAYFNVTLPDAKMTPAEVDGYMHGFNIGTIVSTAVHRSLPRPLRPVPLASAPSTKQDTQTSRSKHRCRRLGALHRADDARPGLRPARCRRERRARCKVSPARPVAGCAAARCPIHRRHPDAHRHCMTIEQAEDFFEKEGFQSKENAEVETKRGAGDPTYLYYTLGKLEIMKLREDMKKKEGAAFSLEKFHDDFLKQGFPPIKIVREAMLGDDSPTL